MTLIEVSAGRLVGVALLSLFTLLTLSPSLLLYHKFHFNHLFRLNNTDIDLCSVFNITHENETDLNTGKLACGIKLSDTTLEKRYTFHLWAYCDVPTDDGYPANCTEIDNYDFDLRSFYLEESNILELYPNLTKEDVRLPTVLDFKDIKKSASVLRVAVYILWVCGAIDITLAFIIAWFSPKDELAGLYVWGILITILTYITNIVCSLLLMIYSSDISSTFGYGFGHLSNHTEIVCDEGRSGSLYLLLFIGTIVIIEAPLATIWFDAQLD